MRRSATGTRASQHCVCRSPARERWNAVAAVHRAVAGVLPLALPLALALASALALPPALAGGMVGPAFKSADPPVAEQWLEAGDPSVRTDRQDYEQWWNAFADPTLSNLIDLAYRQNLTLMAAGTRVLEARATLG